MPITLDGHASATTPRGRDARGMRGRQHLVDGPRRGIARSDRAGCVEHADAGVGHRPVTDHGRLNADFNDLDGAAPDHGSSGGGWFATADDWRNLEHGATGRNAELRGPSTGWCDCATARDPNPDRPAGHRATPASASTAPTS